MSPGRFDLFLFADYSGAASESAQRRAIALWGQERGARPRKIVGPFTRDSLRGALLERLAHATRHGRRALFGIDHQWSWPRDLWRAAGLSALPWRRALSSLVAGSPTRPPLGPPGVFPAAFNAFAGAGIFHCRMKGLARRYGLPSAADWRGEAARVTERLVSGAKPVSVPLSSALRGQVRRFRRSRLLRVGRGRRPRLRFGPSGRAPGLPPRGAPRGLDPRDRAQLRRRSFPRGEGSRRLARVRAPVPNRWATRSRRRSASSLGIGSSAKRPSWASSPNPEA